MKLKVEKSSDEDDFPTIASEDVLRALMKEEDRAICGLFFQYEPLLPNSVTQGRKGRHQGKKNTRFLCKGNSVST